jgi:cell division protein ZapD
VLNGYRGNPAISEAVLDEVTGQLDGCFSALNSTPGKAGQSLTENDWLMSIRSRVGIPGGTCEFDLPAYYAWQHLPAGERRADLQRWATPLAPLAESIHLLLKLLRDSGAPQKVMAPAGQYQQTLPQGAPSSCCACASTRPGPDPGNQRQPPDRVGAPHAPRQRRPAACQHRRFGV